MRFAVTGTSNGAAHIDLEGQLWAELRHLLCGYSRVPIGLLSEAAGRCSDADTARIMVCECAALRSEHGDFSFVRPESAPESLAQVGILPEAKPSVVAALGKPLASLLAGMFRRGFVRVSIKALGLEAGRELANDSTAAKGLTDEVERLRNVHGDFDFVAPALQLK